MDFSVDAHEKITELSGKLGLTEIGEGLMHSVIDAKEKSDDGKLIAESINQGMGSFVPDMLYEQLVQNYSHAEKLYGKTIINIISGYDADYVGKNVQIPEFQRELKKKILDKVDQLKDEGLVDDAYRVTEKGMQLASLVLYCEELDELSSKNLLGERLSKRKATYGSKGSTHMFRKNDRYRDIALKRSVKRALRRKHMSLQVEDLEAYERQRHGAVTVIYGLDASGSMKGVKIKVAKKAGIALSFAAIERKDHVGLVVFSQEIKEAVPPSDDFGRLLRVIASVKAARQTDIVALISKAIELFPQDMGTKHLIVLTDALPTAGSQPEKETLEAVSVARVHGITVSVVGINLNRKGEKFAQRIAELGEGRFYLVRDVDNVDQVVLEDYYRLG
jgi:Mg-chelatase subunit ChlD